MKTAKLIQNGQDQVVHLPQEYHFDGSSVYIRRLGSYVVLIPKDDPWSTMFEASRRFTADFMSERHQGSQPERESFD